MGATLPIAPVRMPTVLDRLLNGSLPITLLEDCGIGGARMMSLAARACRAMAAAMRQAGFELRHVGGYRPYSEQVNLFVSRYEPCSGAVYAITPSSRRKRWPNDARKPGQFAGQTYWRKKLVNGSYPATAATPGTSNHGWGLALDIATELDGDPQPEAITTAMVNWLIANASRFGFSAELQSEAWHWRYVTGDLVPQAVLDFEAGNVAQPAPPPALGSVTVNLTMPILRIGSEGRQVLRLQSLLRDLFGQDIGVPDGKFGARTEAAVRAVQTFFGLPIDGVVGAQTWTVILGT